MKTTKQDRRAAVLIKGGRTFVKSEFPSRYTYSVIDSVGSCYRVVKTDTKTGRRFVLQIDGVGIYREDGLPAIYNPWVGSPQTCAVFEEDGTISRIVK